MLGFCFPLISVTSISMLSLLIIRNGLSLKKVPRFTKITGFSKTLRGRLSLRCLPDGSFLPPSPCRMPSRLPLLLSPWCLSQGRQLSPPGGWLAPLPVPRPPPALSPHSRLRPGCCWPQILALGGRLNPLLLMLEMQEAEPQLVFLMQGRFAAGECITRIFGLVNWTDCI